jgi:hypothetical protein
MNVSPFPKITTTSKIRTDDRSTTSRMRMPDRRATSREG